AMAPLPAVAPEGSCWSWPQPLMSVPGLGELRAEPVIGYGLRTDGSYQLRPRQGGERCRPAGRAHSQSLKKLLQEAGLAPWWRDRLPLIWCGDELAAVADLWICDGFQAQAGASGWALEWQRP